MRTILDRAVIIREKKIGRGCRACCARHASSEGHNGQRADNDPAQRGNDAHVKGELPSRAYLAWERTSRSISEFLGAGNIAWYARDGTR